MTKPEMEDYLEEAIAMLNAAEDALRAGGNSNLAQRIKTLVERIEKDSSQ